MTLLTPAKDTSAADWVVEGMGAFAASVNSVVPGGFAAYLRLFHPTYIGRHHEERTAVRWIQVASATGMHAHAGMQFCALIGDHHLLHTDPLSDVYDEPPEQGSLPAELSAQLVTVLSRHTSTSASCWFAAWSGWGGLRADICAAPEFSLPAREYRLLQGPLDAATESVDSEPWASQSSSLWWPDDRAWLVSTEIDFNTTYIGCDKACRDELVAQPNLEALAIDPATGITCDSDVLNPTPIDGDAQPL